MLPTIHLTAGFYFKATSLPLHTSPPAHRSLQRFTYVADSWRQPILRARSKSHTIVTAHHVQSLGGEPLLRSQTPSICAAAFP